MAEAVFTDHPLTLKWITQAGFREALLRSSIQGSDLQAIALLMGHGSAGTTVEHYLHVLEWCRSGDSAGTDLTPDMAEIPAAKVSEITSAAS